MEISLYSPAFLQDVLTLLVAAQAEGATIEGLIMQFDQHLNQAASLYPTLPGSETRASATLIQVADKVAGPQTIQVLAQCPSCKRAPLLYMGELREEGLRLFACRACRFSRVEEL